MRRILGWGALLIGLAALAFFALAPGIVENSMNKIEPIAGKPSARALALHSRLAVVDLHSDTLMWKRDILERSDRGHMDLLRLRDGNVALQVLSSVTKTPKGQNYDANGADTDNITMLAIAQGQPVRTWTSLLARSLWHAEKLTRAIDRQSKDRNQVQFVIVTRQKQVKALGELHSLQAGPPDHPFSRGLLLSIEGLQNLEGKRENLQILFDAGYRMAGLTHFFDNELAGSMHGLKKGGLTPFGRQIVRDMEAKGMVVDIAHCSHKCVAEVLAMATKPVVSSHGGVQAVCKVNRNLTDDEIRGVAKTGGVIGIGYWDGAICGVTLDKFVASVLHVKRLVGIDHVGLGSDYDGATTVGFDTSKLALVTQALIDGGLSDEEIAKVMGGNVIRVLMQTLPPR